MKKTLSLLLVCCLALAATPALAKKAPPEKHETQKAAAPHEPSGPAETVDAPGKVIKEPNAFNGIKWGTAMAAIPDLTVAERDGQAAYATAEGVVYRIGEAFLSGVVYGFCQDKFAAVMVEYKGKKTTRASRTSWPASTASPSTSKARAWTWAGPWATCSSGCSIRPNATWGR
ncbi:hypothetical protein [Solidesulfovibrio carbinolicus]|uniref:hypothetical protein n=1 Tax=Solidesulfovibrio carbinolicus TaxID=296842 RepID=UPI001F1A3993|nr:hypothetical protein [Solidesulfovibrio carbinolicus]